MLFDNPEDDKKFREAIYVIADFADSDAELTLLVNFIHDFFTIKREREQRQEREREQRRNKVIKLKPVDD